MYESFPAVFCVLSIQFWLPQKQNLFLVMAWGKWSRNTIILGRQQQYQWFNIGLPIAAMYCESYTTRNLLLCVAFYIRVIQFSKYDWWGGKVQMKPVKLSQAFDGEHGGESICLWGFMWSFHLKVAYLQNLSARLLHGYLIPAIHFTIFHTSWLFTAYLIYNQA